MVVTSWLMCYWCKHLKMSHGLPGCAIGNNPKVESCKEKEIKEVKI